MRAHWHGSVDNILLYGLSAILVINLGRIGAGWLVKKGGKAAALGESVGALL